MKAHLTREQLELFIQRKLQSEELLEVDQHLATCENCRARLLGLIPMDSLSGAFFNEITQDSDGTPTVPPSEKECDCEDSDHIPSPPNKTNYLWLSKTL